MPIKSRGFGVHDLEVIDPQPCPQQYPTLRIQNIMEGEQGRVSSLNNSVYVRGFPSGSATEETLVKIFSQFGPVKKVYIDTAKGVYAIVEFADENCAFAALSQSNNLCLNDKRLVVKPREIKEPSIKTKPGSKKKTIISGKPSTSKKPLKAPKSKISMSDASDLDQGISHSQGRYPMLTDDLFTKLSYANSVEDKIKMFYEETRLSGEAVEKAISICNLIEQACSLVIPNCKALPYGSLISGFGSYKSDLDICILTECTKEDEDFISGGYLNIGGVAYSFYNINEKAKSYFSDATADVDLQLLANTISMHVPGALRVRHIKTAKCPVIKFFYAPANKECDVTINNRLALCNSFLLKKYSQFDSRLAPLISIVCGIVRASGINGRIFSSYSISLMVIYALQHCTPPVLPCLQDIGEWPLTTATASELTVPYGEVEGWPFSFHPIENLQPSSNQQGLGALLNHFVSFYSTTFDFKDTSISIQSSATLDIKNAIEVSKSHSSTNLTRVFKVGPVCIQDPIELSHNVSQNLMIPPFTSLLQKFSAVSDLLETLLSSEAVGSTSIDSNVDFLQLFKNTKPSIKKTHFYAVDLNFEQASAINKLVPGQPLFENQTVKSVITILESELAFECTCLSEDGETRSTGSDDDKATNLTDTVIVPNSENKSESERRGVKRSLCDPELVMAAAKRPRMQDSISSVDSNVSEGEVQISLQFQCKSTSNTWTNRRKMRRKAAGTESSTIPVDYSHEPIEFIVTVLTNVPGDVEIAARVLLVPAQSCDIKDFQVFFAFFKKHLLHYTTQAQSVDEDTAMDDDKVPSTQDNTMQ